MMTKLKSPHVLERCVSFLDSFFLRQIRITCVVATYQMIVTINLDLLMCYPIVIMNSDTSVSVLAINFSAS